LCLEKCTLLHLIIILYFIFIFSKCTLFRNEIKHVKIIVPVFRVTSSKEMFPAC
jgi:hypothetical protein